MADPESYSNCLVPIWSRKTSQTSEQQHKVATGHQLDAPLAPLPDEDELVELNYRS